MSPPCFLNSIYCSGIFIVPRARTHHFSCLAMLIPISPHFLLYPEKEMGVSPMPLHLCTQSESPSNSALKSQGAVLREAFLCGGGSRLTSPGPLSPWPLCTLWFQRLAHHAPLCHLKGGSTCLYNTSCNDVCRPKWVKFQDQMETTWAPVLQLDHFFLPFLFLGKPDSKI